MSNVSVLVCCDSFYETIPWLGFDFDGFTSVTVTLTFKQSPTGEAVGHLKSTPAPINPSFTGDERTANCMLIAAVNPPLPDKPRKNDSSAASGSVWKGCGSHYLAKEMISSLINSYSALLSKTSPTVISSKYKF